MGLGSRLRILRFQVKVKVRVNYGRGYGCVPTSVSVSSAVFWRSHTETLSVPAASRLVPRVLDNSTFFLRLPNCVTVRVSVRVH